LGYQTPASQVMAFAGADRLGAPIFLWSAALGIF
jgi:hypothetical protein